MKESLCNGIFWFPLFLTCLGALLGEGSCVGVKAKDFPCGA